MNMHHTNNNMPSSTSSYSSVVYLMLRDHYSNLFGQKQWTNKNGVKMCITEYKVTVENISKQVLRSCKHGDLDKVELQFDLAARMALKASAGK